MCVDHGFASELSDQDLFYLMNLGNKMGFDPLSSEECEQYFLQLTGECSEDFETRKQQLKQRVQQDFRCFDKPPVWIQGSEWAFCEGKPMWFVGQTDILESKNGFCAGMSFYLFWNPQSGETKTVVQCD